MNQKLKIVVEGQRVELYGAAFARIVAMLEKRNIDFSQLLAEGAITALESFEQEEERKNYDALMLALTETEAEKMQAAMIAQNEESARQKTLDDFVKSRNEAEEKKPKRITLAQAAANKRKKEKEKAEAARLFRKPFALDTPPAAGPGFDDLEDLDSLFYGLDISPDDLPPV